jgi:chromosome segregation ATPase
MKKILLPMLMTATSLMANAQYVNVEFLNGDMDNDDQITVNDVTGLIGAYLESATPLKTVTVDNTELINLIEDERREMAVWQEQQDKAIAVMSSAINNNTAKISDLQAAIENLKNLVNKGYDDTEIYRLIESLESDMKVLQDREVQTEMDVQQVIYETQKNEVQIKNLENNVTTNTNSILTNRNNIENNMASIQGLQELVNYLMKENGDHNDVIIGLSSENAKQKDAIYSLQQQNEDQQDRIEILEMQNRELQTAVANLQIMVDKMNARLTDLENKINQ